MAQIARTIARQLCLDEDLAECLALAHDLGHPPFGHAGERALDEVMRAYGGFDHNAQSLRIVTKLERRYAGFDGLNLTWETLEGLAQHNGPIRDSQSATAKVTAGFGDWQNFDLASWPSAEAQAAAIADDIAYLAHDIDDGLRAGLLNVTDLEFVPHIAGVTASIRTRDEGRINYEITRRMITILIRDVVAESRKRLRRLSPASPDDIRAAQQGVVAFSGETAGELEGIRSFLFERVYHSRRVMTVMRGAEQIVRDLFRHFWASEGRSDLPHPWSQVAQRLSLRGQARLIADYLAGMTDRYAIARHRRLFDATPELR